MTSANGETKVSTQSLQGQRRALAMPFLQHCATARVTQVAMQGRTVRHSPGCKMQHSHRTRGADAADLKLLFLLLLLLLLLLL
eukprot:236379-Alexandrium_andersonii.AAC.1